MEGFPLGHLQAILNHLITIFTKISMDLRYHNIEDIYKNSQEVINLLDIVNTVIFWNCFLF